MSLATICAGVALRVGVQASAPWYGSSDLTTQQICAFVQEGLTQVAGEFDWQALMTDLLWTAPVDQNDGLELPDSVERIIPDTVWVRVRNMQVTGPLSVPAWEQLRREYPNDSPRPYWTFAGGLLLLRGVTAGDVVTAVGKMAALTTAGVAGAGIGGGIGGIIGGALAGIGSFQTDADTALLDERLIGMAAEMLYRDAKGLPPGASGRYPVELAKARANDRPIGVMSVGMQPGRRTGSPVVVSGGSGILNLT